MIELDAVKKRDKGMPMNEKVDGTGMEVVAVTPGMVEEVTGVLVEAFKGEETTNYHLDMKNPSTPRRMAVVDGIYVRLYLEAGRPVLAAVNNGRVTGVGMVRDPRIHISRRRAVSFIARNLHHILALYGRRPIHGLRILRAVRQPRGLTKPYFTFEALGVHPDHQGKGAGRALMRAVQASLEGEQRISGIYLSTGSEKNRAFYERLGYDTLRVDDLGEVKVYHLFWQNPTFG